MDDSRWFHFPWPKLILLITVVSLTFPVSLFSVFNYEVNPALFLAPICLVAVAKYRKDIASKAFIVMGLLGSLSVLLVNVARDDNDYLSNFSSLTLIMFSISFLFVGRMLVEIHGVQKIVKYLAFSSALFIVISGARLVFSGDPVRFIFLGEDGLGYVRLNLDLLGLPIFGDFGVISLADLILIEFLLVVAYFILGHHNIWTKIFLGLSIFIGSYVVVGSDSRGLLVSMALALLMLSFAWRKFSLRRVAISIVLALTLAASIFSITRESYSDRLGQTIKSVNERNKEFAKRGSLSNLDAISTGRVLLIEDAIRDIRVSPILGTGFDGYGSLGNKASTQNSSTHVYYLTLLWKGGILFFLSYLVLVIGDLRKIFRRGLKGTYIEYRYFLSIPLVLGLTFLAFTWDILAVPSAGALIYFIFGLLRGAKDHELSSVS